MFGGLTPWEEGGSSIGCDEDSGTEDVSLSVVPSSTGLDEAASAEDDGAGAADTKAFKGEAELF